MKMQSEERLLFEIEEAGYRVKVYRPEKVKPELLDGWEPSDKPGYMKKTMRYKNAIVHVHKPILTEEVSLERKKALVRACVRFSIACEKQRKQKEKT